VLRCYVLTCYVRRATCACATCDVLRAAVAWRTGTAEAQLGSFEGVRDSGERERHDAVVAWTVEPEHIGRCCAHALHQVAAATLPERPATMNAG